MSSRPDITALIERAGLTAVGDGLDPYAHLGASIAGHPCDAYLQLSLRGYPEAPIPPGLKRIFRDGHKLETSVIADMRKAGIDLLTTDPLTGQQWRYTMLGGHVSGRADGIGIGDAEEIYLVEIKSMNDSKWSEFKRAGVRVSHPNYYGQVMLMMGMSEIWTCVLVAYNKNSSRYHHEWVEFDPFAFFAYKAKLEEVLAGRRVRLARHRADYRCQGCFKRTACWDGLLPTQQTIRSCASASPQSDGSWACDRGCHVGGRCQAWTPIQVEPRA